MAVGDCYHCHADDSYLLDRSNLCTVGAPFLAVAKGRKIYWELTILEAQGSVRLGFAGTKTSSAKISKVLGHGKKSWCVSSENGNGYHRCK